jgi:urocanate hydratase
MNFHTLSPGRTESRAVRHVDAGYEEAWQHAQEHGIKIPMKK